MSEKRTATCIGGKNEDIFLAGVEYLAKKYKIENYTLITKNSYRVSAETDTGLELKRELVKVFNK